MILDRFDNMTDSEKLDFVEELEVLLDELSPDAPFYDRLDELAYTLRRAIERADYWETEDTWDSDEEPGLSLDNLYTFLYSD